MAHNESLHQEFTRKWGFEVNQTYLAEFVAKHFEEFSNIFSGVVNPKFAHEAFIYQFSEAYGNGLRRAKEHVTLAKESIASRMESVDSTVEEIAEFKASIGFFQGLFRRKSIAKDLECLENSLKHRKEMLEHAKTDLEKREKELKNILENPSEWEIFVRASELAIATICSKYSIFRKLSASSINQLYYIYNDHSSNPRRDSRDLVEFYENGNIVMLLSMTSEPINFEKTTPVELLEKLLHIKEVDELYREIVLSQMVGCNAFSPMPARSFYCNYQPGRMLEAA